MTCAPYFHADGLIRAVLVLVLAFGSGWVMRPFVRPAPLQRELRAAAWALAAHQYGAAEAAAARALEFAPDSTEALLLAGSAAAGRRDEEGAIALFERVPADVPQKCLADLGAAQCWQALGKVAHAERCYRRALARDPESLEAHRRLGFLLQSEGRTWESVEHLAALLFRGEFSVDVLLAVAAPERFFFIDPKIERMLTGPSQADVLTRLAEVRSALLDGREREVEALLREIVARHPDVAEAQARLGRLLFDSGDREALLAWNARLSPEHERHPEVWFVRGLFVRREGNLPAAVRCFLETLVRSPNHVAAHYQVAGCLAQLGELEQSAGFSRRVPLLSRVDIEINLIRKARTGEVAGRLSRLLHELGRHWEAAGWAYAAGQFEQPLRGSQAVYFEEARTLSAAQGLTTRDAQPALRMNLGRYPLPKLPKASTSAAPEIAAASNPGRFAGWRFADEASAAELKFAYYEGSSLQTRLQHVFQTFGGGVGAIDFDSDGWPDLYLTQANDWRRPTGESKFVDQLFRNTGTGQFVDVTEPAGLGDTGFSHGVAVGDYDCDGWPDLYVANLGPNRFYHNNGDGTFSDVSAATGTQGDEWSTSCAIVDLTGDGLPELFVVNYSDRDYAVNNPCFVNGIEVSCTADSLPPVSSRLYANLGDGHFRDISRETGVAAEKGLGLGLVAADFQGDGRLSIFVGNDTTPNFYFRSTGSDARGVSRFVEQGALSGLAFSAEGSVMASMGIAAGDANGDGRLDLFVTTFKNDPDRLFVQQADGTFSDGTRGARLHEPTFAMLGFGTQFLDADNDGWEDLVVANGHVLAPLPGATDPQGDKMPAQLFANLGDGTFAEVPADRLGPYFQAKGLGRGLAELDWNRDGRQDFCVSHLHSPAALVTNGTPAVGHRLVVRLIGTRSSRDAFGAVGRLRAGSRRLTRHLAAGSGYLASNERRLWFGLGQANRVDELSITWPGGAEQRLTNLPVDQEILIIEQRQQPFILRRWNADE